MGSTSVSGIGFAALTGAWAISTIASAAEPQGSELRVEVSALRNSKGLVHACLTQDQSYFPDCKADARALRLTVPAAEADQLAFPHLASGTYALSIIHDENANGKLDTFVKVPREGYGFSGNPPMRFGPPRFAEASFTVTHGRNLQAVRMRYLL